MNEFKQLDVDLLTGYQANLSPVVLRQMYTLYKNQSIEYIEQISQALDAEQQEWQQRCHKMKGAAGSVGFSQVHALLVNMEKSVLTKVEKVNMLEKLQHLNELALHDFDLWLGN